MVPLDFVNSYVEMVLRHSRTWGLEFIGLLQSGGRALPKSIYMYIYIYNYSLYSVVSIPFSTLPI